ncbi:ATP-binding protein [Paenibacillus sp. IHB B 3415]|uniref:thiol reductant ABC exporter subunit CydC n=1 Tax=Paenibacillus sp. IHB B 3415 TaxID=867080 RepID=UPI0005738C6E|nr:thiol reductant ABC exporter subunit CydC [Paenibacillus sp. IHB B 3415]KHL96169.1 ATP-binding protein [Paenibacillus sp. IHB B 3415]
MKREGWFAPYYSAYFWRFVLIIALGALTIFSASSLMYTSGFLISKASIPPENILMIYVPIVGVRTFGTSRAVIHYVERLVGHDTILRILSKMRIRLYNILEPQALFLSSRFRTGDILGMLADDIEYLQNVYLRTVFPSIIALLIYAVAVISLGTFDLAFALLMGLYMLILVAVLPLISLLFTQKRQRQVKQERNRLYQKLTDAVLGLGDWVISGRQSQFVDTYEADEQTVARTDGALRRWARLRMFIGQAVVGLGVLSLLYWAGGQYADGAIAGTLIAAFVLVVFPVADAFLPVSEAVEKIPQYRNSLERLNGVEAAEGAVPPAAEAAKNAEAKAKAAAAVQAIQASGQAHIELKSAGYRYAAGDDWSVQNMALDLPQGRKVAVIGRSGAGKSTLLKMVQGVITPTIGSATINGIDAAAYGEQIPQLIAVLNQSPHLFDTTVANNIRLGDPGASEAAVKQAAALAKLDPLISSLPEGYNTPVREAGQRFSGGERQRMALARILLQNTPVVVLDEPTVGLDPRTERELLATMFEAMAGKTLIWVTHHLVGAEQMDEVIFMENGLVEMRGTHAELMEREPRYRKLYELDRPSQFMNAAADK